MQPETRWRQILIAADGSAGSLVAAERAFELASLCKARLTAVFVQPTRRTHTVRLQASRSVVPPALTQFVSRARAAGISADSQLASGDPGPAILATARTIGADLIVIGRHGWPFDAEHPKTTCGYLLNHSDRPVLVVQPWAPIRGHASQE